MRRLLSFLLVVSVLCPSLALAEGGKHPMAGCGLGYILFGKSQSGISPQTLAYTTNGTSESQLFGITSGTSGCTPEGLMAMSKQTERFVEINFESLRSEIAAGEGEYVAALMDLLDVKPLNRGAVTLLLKKDYEFLFPAHDTRFDEFLGKSCTNTSICPDYLSLSLWSAQPGLSPILTHSETLSYFQSL